MRYLFLVQGEGRGHMTQAIELARILSKNGHEISHTFIGKSDRRKIPDYFYKKIPSKITELSSPNFVLDSDNKSLDIWKSITFNARFLRKYKGSLDLIHREVKSSQPDVLINFYDFLGGFYFRLYQPKGIRHVCIGRQFLTFHPNYLFEKGRDVEKRLFMINNKITSQRCDKYLALSFRPYEPQKVGNVVAVPPLLKDDVRHLKTCSSDFILGYMVNDGYAEEIMAWHQNNKETKLHCFWDRKDKPKEYSPHENLIFHQIDNQLFIDMMLNCKGYATTAGFESVCEAMFLQKPVLMVPVDGQYEQACNALDAEIAGAGIKASSFNISILLDFMDSYNPPDSFKNWVDSNESVFLEELTNFEN